MNFPFSIGTEATYKWAYIGGRTPHKLTNLPTTSARYVHISPSSTQLSHSWKPAANQILRAIRLRTNKGSRDIRIIGLVQVEWMWAVRVAPTNRQDWWVCSLPFVHSIAARICQNIAPYIWDYSKLISSRMTETDCSLAKWLREVYPQAVVTLYFIYFIDNLFFPHLCHRIYTLMD